MPPTPDRPPRSRPAQSTIPKPYDRKGNPIGWGPGYKSPGAGCWKAVDREVYHDVKDRYAHC